MFTKQAAKNLISGVPSMFDTHTWTAPRSMNRNLSKLVQYQSMIPCDGSQDSTRRYGILLLLEVQPEEGSLYIYQVTWKSETDSQPQLQYLLSPRNLSQYLPPYPEDAPNPYRIVRVAWKGVLFQESRDELPIVAILYTTASTAMTLIMATMDPEFGPLVTATYVIEPSSEGSAVAALAIDEHNEPVIAWRRAGDTHSLTTYNPFCEVKAPENIPILPECIVDMEVRKRTAVLYPQIVQLPYWTANPYSYGKFLKIPIALPYWPGIIQGQAHGVPIAQDHRHKIRDKDIRGGRSFCINTALKLSVCREVPADARVPDDAEGVFVLKVIQSRSHCRPFDHYTYQDSMEHLFVARLSDPPCLTNLPSNGLKVAISPRSRRIALAAWRTLRIYSIEPLAFLNSSYAAQDHFLKYPSDYAYTEECGYNYYKNNAIGTTGVVLEPVDIPSSGVIYGIQWRNEDELWAWTDEGVCKWNLGVWTNGRRGISELQHSCALG